MNSRPDDPHGLDWARRIELAAIATAAILSPLIAAAAIWYSNNQVRDQLEVSSRELGIAQEAQITDRYTKAVESLGDDAEDVRLGGIYALQRIMEDSPRDHPTIVNVLATYIRTHAIKPPKASKDVPSDVQAALTVLADRDLTRDDRSVVLRLRKTYLAGVEVKSSRFSKLPMNLAGADLFGADLSGADLSDVDLSRADLFSAALSRADLSHADLSDTDLSDADLAGVNLVGANLSNANLSDGDLFDADRPGADPSELELTEDWIGANLSKADLSYAHLPNADLSDANLSDAILSYAILKNANLASADLSNANLAFADLSNANLSNAKMFDRDRFGTNLAGADLKGAKLNNLDLSLAKGLTAKQVTLAVIDKTTKLPPYLAKEPAVKARIAEGRK